MFPHRASYYESEVPVVSNEDTLINIEELVNTKANINTIRNQIKDLTYIADLVERENIITKAAFNRTADDLYNLGIKFIISEAYKAVIETEEFNFDGWPEQLIDAIRTASQDNIILTFDFDEEMNGGKGGIHWANVDLSPLGNSNDYAQIVESARKKAPTSTGGKLPEKPYIEPLPGMDLASYFWMEKYYKPAREGTDIQKFVKKKGKKGESSGEGEWVEMDTKKFIAAYFDTMKRRLGFMLDSGTAPFWEILDLGNADVKFTTDRGGVPYPVFKGTNFIANAENAIFDAFKQAFEINKELVKEEYADLVRGPVSDKLEETLEEMGYDDVNYIVKIKEEYTEIEPNKTITKINADYNLYQSEIGTFAPRYARRGAGGKFAPRGG